MGNLDKLLRRLVPIICIGVVVNLTYTWFSTDQRSIDFSNFSIKWLLVTMVLAMLPWAWHSLRLAIWGRFFGVEIAWKHLLRIAIATDVGGVMMPAAVGGAPLKMSLLVRHGYPPGQAATLTLWGNIEDALFYTVAIPVSLCLTRNWDNPIWLAAVGFLQKNTWHIAAALAVAVLVGVLLQQFLRGRKHATDWTAKLRHLLGECRSAFLLIFSKGRKPFLWSFLAISAQWISRFAILLSVVQVFGLEADLPKLLFLQWMVFVAMLLTPTPGATGGAEAAFLLVFSSNLPIGTAAMVMVGWRLLTYYFIIVVGAVYLTVSNSKLE